MRYILLCLLFTGITFGQNIKKLDEKNGFNKFKLGSDISLYKNDLKVSAEQPNGVVEYRYMKDDITDLYELKVESVILNYYKGKLYMISILFDEESSKQDKNVRPNLVTLFGEPQYKMDNEGKIRWGYVWDSEKVFLLLCQYKEDEYAVENKILISLKSNTIKQQILSDGF
jgi:hypothetical protein